MPLTAVEQSTSLPTESGPRSQTERSIVRGFRLRRLVDDQWGRSESLDPDDVGDIADEGAGHRG